MATDKSVDSPKPRLLVVDDSRLMRVAARKILNLDFDIVEAADGELAWEQLQRDSAIDLVMSDLSMPNLDGLSLLKSIRGAADEGLRNLPVIIVTGAEDDDGSRQTALAAGASDFITKPFDSVQLLARAKSQARQQSTSRSLRESQAAQRQLQQASGVDPLTGLANEQALRRRGAEDLSYAARHHTELALLCLRIDNFKALVLRHGGPATEAVERRLATLLTENRRREDSVARIAAGDFALLLPSANHHAAQRLGEQLRHRIEQASFACGNDIIKIGVSTAVACPPDERNADFGLLLESARAELMPAQAAAVVAIDEAGAAPAAATPEQVERALRALAGGQPPGVEASALVAAILPLLEHWNNRHPHPLGSHIDAIRRALQG